MNLYDSLVAYIVENQNKFYRFAYSYVRNQNDAMDVVQNSIYKSLKNINSLRNEKAMHTWFYSILVNESLNMVNEKKKYQLSSQKENSIEPVYIEERFELKDEIHEKIALLEEPEQSIIRLRFFDEMSLQEIADVLNMNLSTVKSKLYRGLKKMKLTMSEGEAI